MFIGLHNRNKTFMRQCGIFLTKQNKNYQNFLNTPYRVKVDLLPFATVKPSPKK